MTKEEILHLANSLFDEAVAAKSYWLILQQFEKNTTDYHDEVNCSPAFYTIVFQALTQSLFMNLSKVYDWHKKSLTIRTFLAEVQNITEEDFESGVRKDFDLLKGKFQHSLTPYEEMFFPNEVQEQKDILKIFRCDYRSTTVNLTLQEMKKLYQDRFDILKQDTIPNLINRRNIVFAHNDAETNFDYAKAAEHYPVTEESVILLIDFAIECLQFYISILSGTYKLAEYININDWTNTLHLVRMGTEYRDIQLKVFMEQE